MKTQKWCDQKCSMLLGKNDDLFAFFPIFLLVLFSLLSSPTQAKQPHDKYSDRWIALVLEYTSSDYNKRLIEGAMEEAKALGLRLEVLDAKNNKNSMPNMIDDVTLRNVDGILISHGAPDLLMPSVKRSLRREIPIVAIHCNLSIPGVTLLGQDDRLIADMVMNKMIADTGGDADFVLIWVGGYEPMEQRIEVYDKIMSEQSGLKEIARFGTAGEGTALHTEIMMKGILDSHPEGAIDAVIATWDEYAKGAARAIKKEGRKEIRLYGIDISSSVLEMLQDPENPWVATVGVDSKILGKVQVRMLAHALDGGTLPKRHTLSPVMITKSMLPLDHPVTMADLPRYVPGWEDAEYFPLGNNTNESEKE